MKEIILFNILFTFGIFFFLKITGHYGLSLDGLGYIGDFIGDRMAFTPIAPDNLY